MKKTVIAVGAVLALAASYLIAAEIPATITGSSSAVVNGKIISVKLSNTDFIPNGAPKGSVVLYATSGGTLDFIIVAAPNGTVISTDAVLQVAGVDAVAGPVTNGSTTTIVEGVPFDIAGTNGVVGAGGNGELLLTATKVTTKTSTNRTYKGSGVFEFISGTETNPGSFSLSATGTFKPKI